MCKEKTYTYYEVLCGFTHHYYIEPDHVHDIFNELFSSALDSDENVKVDIRGIELTEKQFNESELKWTPMIARIQDQDSIIKKLQNIIRENKNGYVNELYQKALTTWGKEAQLWQVVEEIGEFLTAMNKFIKRKQITPRGMASEVADVQIMLEQFTNMFNLQILVDEEKYSKLRRLAKRLSSDE